MSANFQWCGNMSDKRDPLATSLNDGVKVSPAHFFKIVGCILSGPGVRFSKLPVITGPVKLFCFPLRMGVSKKLLAKEIKWTSLEVRTQHTFLETLISKCDTGPVKLPGLSRNGPQEIYEVSTRLESC